jgi:hypothetical protein
LPTVRYCRTTTSKASAIDIVPERGGPGGGEGGNATRHPVTEPMICVD